MSLELKGVVAFVFVPFGCLSQLTVHRMGFRKGIGPS